MLRTSLPAIRRTSAGRRISFLATALVATAVATVLTGPSAAASPTPATSPSAAGSPTSAISRPAETKRPAPAPEPTVAADTPTTTSDRSGPAKGGGSDPLTSSSCGGKLALGRVASCASIVDAQQHRFTVTTSVDSDVLVGRLTHLSGDLVQARVTDRAGGQLCVLSSYSRECQLGPAGRYTVTVFVYHGTGTASYLLSFESRKAPSACETLSEEFFSFASPGRSGTLPAGLAARCFTFVQPTGAVLHLADPSAAGDVQGSVVDAAYEPAGCEVRYTTECTLTGAGPYKLFLQEFYGNQAEYTLKLPRISRPVGCPALPLVTFGDPGSGVGSGTVPANESVTCHGVTSTAAGPVLVRLNRSADQHLNWRVYDTDGHRVCEEWSAERSCTLPSAGSYLLMAENRNWEPVDYQVAVAALDATEGCAPATGTAWNQPALVVHQTSPVQTNCQPFTGAAGDRVVVYRAPHAWNELRSWLVDDRGTVLCTEWSEEDGCVLPANGTYRVISYLADWYADSTDLTYRMQVRLLNDGTDCPTITPGSYGASPATPGGVRCRVLDIPAAGAYRVRAVDAQNAAQYATVYDAAGLRACTGDWCGFTAPGRYTLILSGAQQDTVIDNDYVYTVRLLPVAPSNCVAVSDDGHTGTSYQGSFDAAGEMDCVRLPSPAGARIVRLVAGDATGAARPEITVVDATGKYVCDYNSLYQYSCELTGTAPFHAVLTSPNGAPTGAYRVAFSRVDGQPACPELARDATGATVTTGADRFAACFTVPADQHGARESFTWRRTNGTGDASLSVFTAAGVRYCGPTGQAVERTVTCYLPEGPVTVILETDGVDATYQITHREPIG
ncbi:hypothetical protein ACTMSW_28300 [Micromonospora sp. BQ11]|uniref:hypothetical protein n=1 Tax=Micromonospora sp. BQ11 TaxID=3452212 RepID=UPI003F8C900F